MIVYFRGAMSQSIRWMSFIFMAACLEGCQYFMSPKTMVEATEADELCYQWKEQTRKEVMVSGIQSTLYNRGCRLNSEQTMFLGLQGNYLTGNQKQDETIMAGWTVVKTFSLNN